MVGKKIFNAREELAFCDHYDFYSLAYTLPSPLCLRKDPDC